MDRQSKGMWLELTSASVLRSYMAYRGESVRTLAAKCVVGQGSERKALHRSVIGHLLTGQRRTCIPSTAAAIEKALDVPSGVLFTPRHAVQLQRAA